MLILLVTRDPYRMTPNLTWFGDTLYCVGIDATKVTSWRKSTVDTFSEPSITNITSATSLQPTNNGNITHNNFDDEKKIQ